MRRSTPKQGAGMLAIDTNLIVRYLTGDHPQQSPKAKALIDSEDVFVSTTVLLETEWVLRSAYEYTPDQIARALTAFAGLPRVTLDDAALAAKALDWMGSGMDFADSLHLAKAEGCKAFVTFDRRFAKAANLLSEVKVREP
jgi:predicted nucleic-acid-binding protein